MRFQVMTEFPHLRSRDTYDVTDCDSGDHIVQSVTHAEATFIAAVLNREVTADDLRIEALFIAAMLNERNEASIKAEALREAADDLATYDLTDRQNGYLLAGRHIIARLRARADQIEAHDE